MFVSLFKVIMMRDIEAVLIRAWKFALSKGNTELAEAIASLPMFETETKAKPVEEKKPAPAAFRIPSGKFAGRKLDSLSGFELKNLWAGFNGCGNSKVSAILRAELDVRGIK